MLDITFVILTFNEEIHIGRALNNIKDIAKEIFVVDCFSTDATKDICMRYPNVKFVEHEWPGNQAEQFNWALDHLPINTKWVFRLDADEYLTPELINELQTELPGYSDNISAAVLPLGKAFLGRVLKHGDNNKVRMIRLFRKGQARYDVRLMDEHLNILSGQIVHLNGRFVDDSLISLRRFIDKHNNYSNREAALLLDAEYHLSEIDEKDDKRYADEIISMRKKKEKYAKLPLFWRCIAYFFYRYVFLLGFLDGKEGFLCDFLQGLWYRILVDAKIYEIKKKSHGDKSEIKKILDKEYGIKL